MADIKESFSRILAIIKKTIPTAEKFLSAGASDKKISEMQNQIGEELPEDFKEVFRLYNGEKKELYLMAGLKFFSTEDVRANYDIFRETKECYEPICTDAISRERCCDNKWIAFAYNEYDCYFAVDLTPANGGKVGQVIALDQEENCTYLMAESMSEFLEKMADWWEKGEIEIKGEDDEKYVEGKDGSFFDTIIGYAITKDYPLPSSDKEIELKDRYWKHELEVQSITSAELAKMKKSFWIDENDVSCEVLAYIGYPEEVALHNNTTRDFHYLGQNTRLKALDIDNAALEGGDLSALKGCINLQQVKLARLTNLSGIEALTSLPKLTEFCFEGELTEQVRSFIGSLPHLNKLTLAGLKKQDSDLSFLSKLQDLTKLEIIFEDNTRLEDLDFLLSMQKLAIFKTNTYARYEGALKTVLRFKNIKEFLYPMSDIKLYLDNTGLTSVGVFEKDNVDINPLEDTKIKDVYLYKSEYFRLTEAARRMREGLRNMDLSLRFINMID